MSYTIDLIKRKKEEFDYFIKLVNKQMEQGAFRTEEELENAKKTRNYYQSVLDDLDEKLKKIYS